MIRLEERPFELAGKQYVLRCNMAVLEAMEEKHGDFDAILQLSVRAVSLELLEAMLTDYAEDQGWEERWTIADLKHYLSYAMLMELDLVGMLLRAISPAQKGKPAASDDNLSPAESGN